MASLPSVELLPTLMLLLSVSELGVVVTEHAPRGVALSRGLESSPEHAVVVTERAPSGVAPLPGVRRACTKQCGVIAKWHGVIARAWHRRHCCCN